MGCKYCVIDCMEGWNLIWYGLLEQVGRKYFCAELVRSRYVPDVLIGDSQREPAFVAESKRR